MRARTIRHLFVAALTLALAFALIQPAEARKATWSKTTIKASKGKVSAYQRKSNGTRRAYIKTNKGSARASSWKLKHGVKASSASISNAKGKVIASRRATVGRNAYTVRTRVGNKTTKIQKKANGTRKMTRKGGNLIVSNSSWNLKHGVKASSTSIKNNKGKVLATKRATVGKNGSTTRTRVGDTRTVTKKRYNAKTNTATRLDVQTTPRSLRARLVKVQAK